jgi:mannitol/fructose-specific phosphotransferase system IIA component (Ntr-type)/transcriptional regulator with XRE-family HTH domain
LRISANISLRELSRTVEVSPTYLSLVENGKQPPPSAVRITQIENALNLPSGYLMAVTQGCKSEVNSLVQEMPESVDFLKVAKQNAMTSSDFMELTGFLNAYGWVGLSGALRAHEPGGIEFVAGSRPDAAANPYLWPFLSEELVFDVVGVKEKESLLKDAVARVADRCNGLEPEIMLKELLERENTASTGIGCGIAIPHACVTGLDRMIAAFLRIPEGLDFDAIDGKPVYMALLLAGPQSSANLHLRLLARIAKLVSHNSFCDSVLGASDAREIISIFRLAEMRIP